MPSFLSHKLINVIDYYNQQLRINKNEEEQSIKQYYDSPVFLLNLGTPFERQWTVVLHKRDG